MKSILIVSFAMLCACSSEPRRDTMEGNESISSARLGGEGFAASTNTDRSVDASLDGDAAIDIAACHNVFDNICTPECQKLPSHTEERSNCFSNCEYLYRVCAGCYGDSLNE